MKTNLLLIISFFVAIGLCGQKVDLGSQRNIKLPMTASIIATPYFNQSGGNEYYVYFSNNYNLKLDSVIKAGLYYVKLDSLGGIEANWYVGDFWSRHMLDINNDKKLDFGVLTARFDSLEIYRQIDSFKFEKMKWNYKVPKGSYYMMCADMNSDGKQDFIFNNVYGRNFEIAYQIDSVNFIIKSIKIPLDMDLNKAWMYAADFNSDGKTDIAWRNDDFDNSFYFYMQQDSGNLSVPVRMVSAGNIFDTDIIDMDNDGLLDIIVAATTNQGASYIKSWKQKSTGLFNSPVVSPFPMDSLASYEGNFIYGDLNCDGFLDAIHVEYKTSFPNKYRVYNCGNNFKFNSFREVVLGWDNLSYITLIDFNGDGRKDLVGTNFQKTGLTVMYNNSLPADVTYISQNIVTYDTTLTGKTYVEYDTLTWKVMSREKFMINGVMEDCYFVLYYGNTRQLAEIIIRADTVYNLETNMCNRLIKDTIHFSYGWKSGKILYKSDNELFASGYIPVKNVSKLRELDENAIELFPNPASDKISLKLPELLNNTTIEWFDFKGGKVNPVQIDDEKLKVYDVTQLQEGSYILRISDVMGVWNKKLVVKH